MTSSTRGVGHPPGYVSQHAFAEVLEPLSQDERLVLSYLLKRKQESRSAIARSLGYSKTKNNSLISSLLALGLLCEDDEQIATQGRSATTVGLTPGLAYVVGIDLGATSVGVGIADARRRLLAVREQPIDVRQGPTTCLSLISDMIDEILAETGIEVAQLGAIGMGVPGPVEFRTGLLTAPPLMPGWDGYSIREHLQELYGAAVFVDNDVNVMALGEVWNRSETIANAIFVKVGTGIGAGIMCRGAIYRGADGVAGDIGHICADPQGPVCHCGNVGCLEAIAAGPSIARRATLAAQKAESELLAELYKEKGALSPEDVGLASRQGDPIANAIIRQSGEYIGNTLAALVNFFNPERIIIGGGITHMGYLLLASIRHAIYHRSLPLSTRHLVIEYAQLGDVSGVTGAVTLGWQELLRISEGHGSLTPYHTQARGAYA